MATKHLITDGLHSAAGTVRYIITMGLEIGAVVDAPVPGAAISLRPWRRGPDDGAPTPGSGGFAAILPIVEPISAGSPPISPRLVRGLAAGWRVWSGPCRSGQVVRRPLDVGSRPRVTLTWSGMTKAQRDAVMAFLRDDCGDGRLAMSIAIDGPGTTPAVVVRAMAPAVSTWEGMGVYRVEVDAEEVYS